jgi:hypothetical protein
MFLLFLHVFTFYIYHKTDSSRGVISYSVFGVDAA